MDNARDILKKAKEYRRETAELLSEMVKIPSFSGKEEAVCKKIVEMCEDRGFDEVRIDGLGSVVARIGSGPQILAFDAHIDTVEIGDPAQWDLDPFSGLIKDGLVHGRGTSDQEGGAASMITAGKILTGGTADGWRCSVPLRGYRATVQLRSGEKARPIKQRGQLSPWNGLMKS
jgi:acetylornithine deacetylase/succinyl-diaminopimelate desuccinylase-like protein